MIKISYGPSYVGDHSHQSDVELNGGESDKGSYSVVAVIEFVLEDAHAGELSDYAYYGNSCWILIHESDEDDSVYIFFCRRPPSSARYRV